MLSLGELALHLQERVGWLPLCCSASCCTAYWQAVEQGSLTVGARVLLNCCHCKILLLAE